MNKIKLMLSSLLMAVVFSGCYEAVPAGYSGKILTGSGWSPDVYPPSKVYVDSTFTMTPEKLFLIQTTTSKYVQPIKVVLKDKLTLSADIIFRGRVTVDPKVVNFVFNDMPIKKGDRIITTDEVYHTYAKMIVLNTAREVISKYGVDDVNTNYARITTELYTAIKPKLKGLPMDISDITIGDIRYPDIVTKAIEQAKERRMAIEREEADVQIALTKAKGREQVAKATYRIRMLEAKQIRDYNSMINKGITDKLIELKRIEVQQTIANNIANNKNVVYMPLPMMHNTSPIKVIK